MFKFRLSQNTKYIYSKTNHSEHCEEESVAVVLCLVEELEVDYGLLLEEVRVVGLRCSVFQDCTVCSQGGASSSCLHSPGQTV